MNRIMKETNIPWIGQVPEDWSITKIGTEFKLRNNKVDDISFPPLSVTKQGIVPQLDTAAKTDAHDNRKQVLAGDFVINSRSDRKQSCGLSTLSGSVSLINSVLFQKADTYDSDYVGYLFKNYGFAEEFYRWGHGIVADLWTTGWDEMKGISIPLPSKDEQVRIVKAIKNKEEKINALIANEEKQIEKLKAYKQALISEVVTKGLDPNAPMKDSGVEWIGKIPYDWRISKIKFCADIFGRIGFRGYTESDLVSESEAGAITLSPTNFNNMKMNYSKVTYLSWHKYYESPEIMIQNGDVLFVKTGSSYGKSSLVVDLPKEATINPQLIVFKNIKQNKKMFSYIIQSQSVKFQTELIVTGGTIPTMSQEKIKNFIIVDIPTFEQKEIVNFLDSKCGLIDSIIDCHNSKIEKLKQYRQSVIYEYVTGKRKVY